MTITDIGILLIVLCVALWAIAAALHRHTVQLEALKSEMQALLKARETGDAAAAAPVGPAEPRNRMESAATHPPANAASKLAARQTLLK